MALRDQPPTPEANKRTLAQSMINKLGEKGETGASEALDQLLTENYQSTNVVEAIIETAQRRLAEFEGE